MSKVYDYYMLAKPGIIRGNLITAIAGFFFASQHHIDWGLFGAIAGGVSLIVGSGCAFNNYLDRNIDKRMTRTKKRALVGDRISSAAALIYATILGAIGFWLLVAFTNTLTVLIGVVGIVGYVLIYGYAKRQGPLGTIIGSIFGATAIVAGYTAVTNQLDVQVLLLFLTMVIWQMPHFYAIAMYSKRDYAAARVPVLPIVRGDAYTRRSIIGYIIAYTAVIAAFFVLDYAGYIFLVLGVLVCLWWLSIARRPFVAKDAEKWARSVYHGSLLVVFLMSALLSLNNILV